MAGKLHMYIYIEREESLTQTMLGKFKIRWKILECLRKGWIDGINTRKADTHENKG